MRRAWGQVFLKYVISHPAVTAVIPATGKIASSARTIWRARAGDCRTRSSVQQIAAAFVGYLERIDMTVLMTGSAGHLGEAVLRTLRGLDRDSLWESTSSRLPLPIAWARSSIGNSSANACAGSKPSIHAATLHKPHVATHSRQEFVDTNISGTLALLEAAVWRRVSRSFVYTEHNQRRSARRSRRLAAEPAAWITEDVVPVPKNIYGVTKLAAEGSVRALRAQAEDCR